MMLGLKKLMMSDASLAPGGPVFNAGPARVVQTSRPVEAEETPRCGHVL